jgi:pterin-4a-carbinolamine dehydratase
MLDVSYTDKLAHANQSLIRTNRKATKNWKSIQNRGKKSLSYKCNRKKFRTYAYQKKEILNIAGQWWHTPLIPALRRQRQADF